MTWLRELGTILRTVMPMPERPIEQRRPSKNLTEAIKRLDCETEEIKKGVASNTNTQVLMQMLEKLK